MGGNPAPPPQVIYKGPTEADIEMEKEQAKKDSKRAIRSKAGLRKKKGSALSFSRRTGFSGSGVFIPGVD